MPKTFKRAICDSNNNKAGAPLLFAKTVTKKKCVVDNEILNYWGFFND